MPVVADRGSGPWVRHCAGRGPPKRFNEYASLSRLTPCRGGAVPAVVVARVIRAVFIWRAQQIEKRPAVPFLDHQLLPGFPGQERACKPTDVICAGVQPD